MDSRRPRARRCCSATGWRITGWRRSSKTSGGRGMHVFVPLRRGAAQDQVRAYAVAIAQELAAAAPEGRDRRSAESQAPGARLSRHHAQLQRPDDRAAVLGQMAAARPRVDAALAGTKSARGSTPACSTSGPPSAACPESRRGPDSSDTGRRCRGSRDQGPGIRDQEEHTDSERSIRSACFSRSLTPDP